jgi:HD superfamily phosphohydrolase
MVETINIFSCNSHMMLEVKFICMKETCLTSALPFLSGLWHQYHQFYSGAVSGIENKHLMEMMNGSITNAAHWMSLESWKENLLTKLSSQRW